MMKQKQVTILNDLAPLESTLHSLSKFIENYDLLQLYNTVEKHCMLINKSQINLFYTTQI